MKFKALTLVLVGLLILGVASAILLDAFGTIEVEADVEQSILVDGKQYDETILASFNPIAGSSFCVPHNLENRAEQNIPIRLESTDEEGITISYRTGSVINLTLNESDFGIGQYNRFKKFNVSVTQTNNIITVHLDAPATSVGPGMLVYIAQKDTVYQWKAIMGYNAYANALGYEGFFQSRAFTNNNIVDIASRPGPYSVERTNSSLTITFPASDFEGSDRLSLLVGTINQPDFQYHKYPSKNFGSTTVSNLAVPLSTIETLDNEFIIEDESEMDFEICYDFHWALVPLLYELETEVQPNFNVSLPDTATLASEWGSDVVPTSFDYCSDIDFVERSYTLSYYWDGLEQNAAAEPGIVGYKIFNNGNWTDWYEPGVNDLSSHTNRYNEQTLEWYNFRTARHVIAFCNDYDSYADMLSREAGFTW